MLSKNWWQCLKKNTVYINFHSLSDSKYVDNVDGNKNNVKYDNNADDINDNSTNDNGKNNNNMTIMIAIILTSF